MVEAVGGGGRLTSFVEKNEGYYARVFEHLVRQPWPVGLNLAALAAGPLWAASRRLWSVFWGGMVGELVAIIMAVRALYPAGIDAPAGPVDYASLGAALGLFAII